MKAVTRITFLNEEGGKFFGEGPDRLLRGVEETGSLRASAARMGMAYSKALRLLQEAEAALGFPLTTRTAGGEGGGGSRLTPAGIEWLEKYEAYRDECIRLNRTAYLRHFAGGNGRLGCVIMASGLGKRFGGNKLAAEFKGRPLVERILDATGGIFDERVLVTRHEDVAAIARRRGITVVLHDLPHRSDVVRLGLRAVGDVDACMFCPGDQPLLRRETVEALAQAARREDAVWRPEFEGVHGAPVVFPRWAFGELLNLPEGKGGGFVAKKYPERLRTLPVQDANELRDADTPEALAELESYIK